MAGSSRALRVSERVYRALLAAYPKGFRDAYGQQMEQTFRDLCRDELRCGGMGDWSGCGCARAWTWRRPLSRRDAVVV
jgi:hypothetical protein